MLLLGHIGIVTFISSLIYLSLLGALIGVLLPDVIDKSLFVLGYAPCSRFVAHSIFFFPVAGLVTYIITRNKKLAIAIAIGSLLHLLQDMHSDLPFLYPFKNYAFFATCELGLVFTPFVIVTEVIGGMLLIFMGVFKPRFLHIRKSLWDRLKTIKMVK